MQYDMIYKREEEEKNIKIIVENMKQVKATTVNHDYYHNGMPGKKNAFLGFDKSEYDQHMADKEENKDINHDKD